MNSPEGEIEGATTTSKLRCVRRRWRQSCDFVACRQWIKTIRKMNDGMLLPV
jgi:hypothetical protein